MIFGKHDDNTLAQYEDVRSRAVYMALMADGHLGYIMPIGGVAAYENQVSVAGVGFDIACGNAAIQATGACSLILDRRGLEELANEIQNTISFGIGRSNRADDAPVNHPLFDDPRWGIMPKVHRETLRQKARAQLGTVGSGNHYVDVFMDNHGRMWVGVHFGSRGLGHTIANDFMALANGKTWGERVPETEALLDLGTQLGRDYWDLMELAGEYAYAGREWVARKVASMFGSELDLVHNHHNFAWREKHFGKDLIVVRKGATPAFPGQRGFVGGSMGDDSVILRGSYQMQPEQEMSMFSTVHGAGRVMSRTQAAGKRNRKTGEIIKPGLVSTQMRDEWLEGEGVILRGGGLDEAPQAYRRLPEVLAAQGDTIEILETLHPLIVVMAGADVFDPYKD